MKRILPEFEFSEQQLNQVRDLAARCSLTENTVKILYGRGMRTPEEIQAFLHPSRERFISPFKMSGMREAVQLITRARDEDWSVLVYGDYDADGICAATIMRGVLRDFGIEPCVCIPERKDGYGLSKELIDEVFDEYFPQLVITVDCGISCAEEVEYIKELGAEVIVTDHHELPEKIPDCICINPKFNDGYIYDNLCGAGVAFKVGCALSGESAYKFLDYAAIATVADSVPLIGENRDIVCEGLKLINTSPRKNYSYFFGKNEKITAHNLSFSIAPKINAAGRMGDAKSALQLFDEADENRIFDLATKLSEYNIERQKYCEELYADAKRILKAQGEIGNVIMLYGENWNTGFLGIVAAKLAEEYFRPVILFVKNGDMLKGSARSVESVNIYEALRSVSEYIAEFGGHSQAAGVNVTQENFNLLYAALDKYLGERYTDEDFSPIVYVSGELDGVFSPRFAKELQLLEPFGVGNRCPLFAVEAGASPVRLVKGQHVSIKNDKIELMYFGGSKWTYLLESSAPKKLIFEFDISQFRGKEYVKGLVRDIVYDSAAGKLAGEEIALQTVNAFLSPKANCKITTLSREEIEEEMLACKKFGTAFIAADYATAQSYKNAQKLAVELFVPSSKSFSSVILVAPAVEADLSGFEKVIFIDGAAPAQPSLDGKEICVLKGATVPECLKELSCKREDLLKVFAAVSANEALIEGANALLAATNFNFGCSKQQALFALKVFEDLKLISFESGAIRVNRGVKTDLKSSFIYNSVSGLFAE